MYALSPNLATPLQWLCDKDRIAFSIIVTMLHTPKATKDGVWELDDFFKFECHNGELCSYCEGSDACMYM